MAQAESFNVTSVISEACGDRRACHRRIRRDVRLREKRSGLAAIEAVPATLSAR